VSLTPCTNVFYVPQALGSPHIVAQEEFVKTYGLTLKIAILPLIRKPLFPVLE
jgi:hypothetical protein